MAEYEASGLGQKEVVVRNEVSLCCIQLRVVVSVTWNSSARLLVVLTAMVNSTTLAQNSAGDGGFGFGIVQSFLHG